MSQLPEPTAAGKPRRRASTAGRLAGLCLIAPLLAGCISAGLDIAGSADVDRTIVTATTSDAGRAQTRGPSDRAAIRDAVASVDLGAPTALPLPWADAESGTTGVVSRVEETEDAGTPCRRFETTVHGYDGVHLYSGRTCRAADGAWRLDALERRS